MKKSDKRMLKKLARHSAITSVLTELLLQIENGSSSAVAKSRNKVFLERAVKTITSRNVQSMAKGLKTLTKSDKYDFRRSCSLTLETSIDLNKKAVKRLGLPAELQMWLTEDR